MQNYFHDLRKYLGNKYFRRKQEIEIKQFRTFSFHLLVMFYVKKQHLDKSEVFALSSAHHFHSLKSNFAKVCTLSWTHRMISIAKRQKKPKYHQSPYFLCVRPYTRRNAKVLSFCSTKKLSAPFKCSGVGVNKRERVLTYTHTSSLRSGWRVRINHNCAAKTQICLHVAERVHINNPKRPQKSRGQRKTHRARWCTPSLLKPTKDGCISLALSYAAEVYI